MFALEKIWLYVFVLFFKPFFGATPFPFGTCFVLEMYTNTSRQGVVAWHASKASVDIYDHIPVDNITAHIKDP